LEEQGIKVERERNRFREEVAAVKTDECQPVQPTEQAQIPSKEHRMTQSSTATWAMSGSTIFLTPDPMSHRQSSLY